MKKITLLSAIVVSVFFVSCTSDSEPTPTTNSIEGKWEYVEEGKFVDNKFELFDYQHSAAVSADFLEIKSNGEINDMYFYNDNSVDELHGVWFKNGNNLTVSFDDEMQVAQVKELNASTLKLEYTINGSKYIKILQRM